VTNTRRTAGRSRRLVAAERRRALREPHPPLDDDEHDREEIHDLGLREVSRIEGEMLEVAKRLGYNDLRR
jgi:hypothetical protein